MLHTLCQTKFDIVCNESNDCCLDDTFHQLDRIAMECFCHTIKTSYCYVGKLTFQISFFFASFTFLFRLE